MKNRFCTRQSRVLPRILYIPVTALWARKLRPLLPF